MLQENNTTVFADVNRGYAELGSATSDEAFRLIVDAEKSKKPLIATSEEVELEPTVIDDGPNGYKNSAPHIDFNYRDGAAERTKEILEAAGWTILGGHHNGGYKVQRPEKPGTEKSGVIYKSGVLVVGSTSTQFVPNKGYSPSAVRAILLCDGDFSKNESELLELGYGSPDGEYRKIPQVEPEAIADRETLSTFDFGVISRLVLLYIQYWRTRTGKDDKPLHVPATAEKLLFNLFSRYYFGDDIRPMPLKELAEWGGITQREATYMRAEIDELQKTLDFCPFFKRVPVTMLVGAVRRDVTHYSLVCGPIIKAAWDARRIGKISEDEMQQYLEDLIEKEFGEFPEFEEKGGTKWNCIRFGNQAGSLITSGLSKPRHALHTDRDIAFSVSEGLVARLVGEKQENAELVLELALEKLRSIRKARSATVS
jgi:hypothetical protein